MFLFLIFTITLFAQHPSGTLTINAVHFKNYQGNAVAYIFRERDEMPKQPWKIENGKIIDGKSTIVFENIPFGAYAVILFHDENSNEVLDHKLFLPAEPMGFSNGWDLTLFSGMPSFEKLGFVFSEQLQEVTIAVEE